MEVTDIRMELCAHTYVPLLAVLWLALQLSALVPRAGLEEDTEFPHLPCGQIPPSSSDFYEWVCLGVLPLKPRSSDGEECGMMLCLLAQHGSFWYFKPVLKPVTAFTPQGLIEPAQVQRLRPMLEGYSPYMTYTQTA